MTQAACPGSPVRFAFAVVLSKEEAFESCSALCGAERELLRAERPVEAARLAAMFEVIEGRLAAG